jgi:prolyl oligopeptidase
MTTFAHGEVVEVIHGIEVKDRYRWLEDRRLPETQEWLSRQEHICDRYFSQNRLYGQLKGIVRNTLSVEVVDQAARVGNDLFVRKHAKGQEQAAIWVRIGGENQDRLLVDPAAIGPCISVSILRISSSGSMLAYSVRSSGTDAMEIRIIDVESGVTLPDRIPLSYTRGFEFDMNGRGFYYCSEPVNGIQDPSIKHHRFGASSSDDISVFSIPWSEHRRLVLRSDAGSLSALVTEAAGAGMVQDLFITAEATISAWKAVYIGVQKRISPLIVQERVFLLDREGARNGRIVELKEGSEPPCIVVPEGPHAIQRCSVIQGHFLISYLVDRQTRIERWSVDGKCDGALVLPSGGSIEVLSPLSSRSSSLFFLHESYTEAPNLWEINFADGHGLAPRQWTVSEERVCATARECWYTSLDGTRVPMMLLEPAEKRLSGAGPVILTGYGGFGAAETPRFSRFTKLMIEFGATIARPCIRGGSEFGEEWHRSATRTRRQTSIDDFLSGAEWLCSEGITDARHLAIMGSSNGGLLVMAAAMQRPDLFEAVLCVGPLLDMVRYERFDYASRWKDEYGTVEDAEEFRALLAYSPYHNVKGTVDYPATLFVSGDADDRCNPAHVRKMSAALQDRTVQSHPIIVDYAQQWGHVPTLSLSERTEALARKIAFLCEQLDVTIPGGACDVLAD